MAGKNYAYAAKMKKEAPEDPEAITLENAAALTIYQLRQELTRRSIFDEIFGSDGEKRHICFENCLEVLVGELVREKEEREAAHAATLEAAKAPEGETLAQKLEREKAERKQAALERSQQRQREKAYFEERKLANEAGLLEKEEKAAAKKAALAAIQLDNVAPNEPGAENNEGSNDTP